MTASHAIPEQNVNRSGAACIAVWLDVTLEGERSADQTTRGWPGPSRRWSWRYAAAMFRDDLHDDEHDASILNRWLVDFQDRDLRSHSNNQILATVPTPLLPPAVSRPAAGDLALN